MARHANPRPTFHKAVSFYKGQKDYTRRIAENLIDVKRWEGEQRPRGYPAGLAFPGDMLKAVLYSRKRRRERDRSRRKPEKEKDQTRTPTQHRVNEIDEKWRRCESCDATAETIDQLCQCTTAPWDAQNTEEWSDENIELRWINDDFGIGAYALYTIEKDTVLSEYVGELVHSDDLASTYLFDVKNDANTTMACIDSLRMGNWTRFINHSCDSNADFAVVRIGEELRYIVKAKRHIRKGQQVTVHYGEDYWKHRNRDDVWCGCGVKDCHFDKAAMRERKKAGRKRLR